MERFCIICDQEFFKHKSIGLSAAVPNFSEKLQVKQLLKWTLCDNSTLETRLPQIPEQEGHVDRRRVCSACVSLLKNCYSSTRDLRERVSTTGYVGKLVQEYNEADVLADAVADVRVGRGDVTPPRSSNQNWFNSPKSRGTSSISKQENLQDLSDSEEDVSEKRKVTPLKRKIMNALSVKKKKDSLSNTIGAIIGKELQAVVQGGFLQKELLPTQTLMDQLRATCPILLNILIVMFKSRRYNTCNPQIRLTLAVAAYMKNRRHNAFQKALAIVLYKNQASKKAYRTFSKLGLCISYSGLLKYLDTMRKGYDMELVQWRKEVEKYIRAASGELPIEDEEDWQDIAGSEVIITEDFESEEEEGSESSLEISGAESDGSVSKTPTKKSRMEPEDDQDIQHIQDETPVTPSENSAFKVVDGTNYYIGVSFSFDNINRLIRRKEYSTVISNQMCQMVSVFAMYSRVPMKAELLLCRSRQKFVDLPMTTWFLTEQDERILIRDCLSEIKKILCRHLAMFKTLRGLIEFSAEHSFSEEMQQISKLVNLGIWPFDESRMEEMFKIMQRIDKYIARFPNGEKCPVPTWGDGATARGVRDAQVHFDINCMEKDETYMGLEALHSLWHRKSLLFQADNNVLMKNQSLTYADGCMPNFRVRFGHTAAKMEVKEDYNHSYKFMRFNLEAYVLAWAMKLLNFDELDINNVPDAYKNEIPEILMEILNQVALKIQEETYHDVLRDVKQDRYCICQRKFDEGGEEADLGCDNHESCSYNWFHRDCLVEECKKPSSKFTKPPPKSVSAGKRKKAKTVKKATGKSKAGEKANKKEKTVVDKPEKMWYCSEACKTSQRDKKYAYSRAVVFAGLTFMGYHSSIRDGDGQRIHTYHKYQFPQLFRNQNTIYIKLTHRMLGMLGGAAYPHIIHAIMHDITVSLKGGRGMNLEIDWVNELKNAAFDALRKRMKGNHTLQAIERASQSLKFVQEMDEALSKAIEDEQYPPSNSKDYFKYAHDFNEAISIILNNEREGDLLTNYGERHHAGFADFCYNLPMVRDMAKMTHDIKVLSRREDAILRYSEDVLDSDNEDDIDIEADN